VPFPRIASSPATASSGSMLHPKDEDLSLGTPAWAILLRPLRELLPLRGFESLVLTRGDEVEKAGIRCVESTDCSDSSQPLKPEC
jgi:hypothetical protein